MRWCCSRRCPARRSTRLPASPTTCAATRSATRSPTSSTATSTSPTSVTPAAGSAPSRSGAPTPTPTRCRSTRSARAPTRPCGRCDRGLHAGRHLTGAARHRVLRPRPRDQAPPARRCTCTRSARWRSSTARRGWAMSIRDWLIAAKRGGRRLAARHGGGDPRRRRPLGADQGQAAGRHLGRGRHHGAPHSGCRPPRR